MSDPRTSTLARTAGGSLAEAVRVVLSPDLSDAEADAFVDAVAALEAEAARLREDSKRLDWLDENGSGVFNILDSKRKLVSFDLTWEGGTDVRPEIRAAIDAARLRTPPDRTEK